MNAPRANRTLIRGGILLTLDPAVGNSTNGDVLVEDDKIVAVGVDLDVEDVAITEAAGMIVMSGLIDAHRHAWQGTLRRLMPNVETLDSYVAATHFSLARHYRLKQDMLSRQQSAP